MKHYYGFTGEAFIDLGQHESFDSAQQSADAMEKQGHAFFYITSREEWLSIFKTGCDQVSRPHSQTMKTKTIFRTFLNSGDTIALFPEIPADVRGDFCESYQHTGQHGAADPMGAGMCRLTRPATPEEVRPLLAELVSVGYDVRPCKRVSFQMHRARRRMATGCPLS